MGASASGNYCDTKAYHQDWFQQKGADRNCRNQPGNVPNDGLKCGHQKAVAIDVEPCLSNQAINAGALSGEKPCIYVNVHNIHHRFSLPVTPQKTYIFSNSSSSKIVVEVTDSQKLLSPFKKLLSPLKKTSPQIISIDKSKNTVTVENKFYHRDDECTVFIDKSKNTVTVKNKFHHLDDECTVVIDNTSHADTGQSNQMYDSLDNIGNQNEITYSDSLPIGKETPSAVNSSEKQDKQHYSNPNATPLLNELVGDVSANSGKTPESRQRPLDDKPDTLSTPQIVAKIEPSTITANSDEFLLDLIRKDKFVMLDQLLELDGSIINNLPKDSLNELVLDLIRKDKCSMVDLLLKHDDSIINNLPKDSLNELVLDLIREDKLFMLKRLLKADSSIINNLPKDSFNELVLDLIRKDKLFMLKELLKPDGSSINNLPKDSLNELVLDLIRKDQWFMLKLLIVRGFDINRISKAQLDEVKQKLHPNEPMRIILDGIIQNHKTLHYLLQDNEWSILEFLREDFLDNCKMLFEKPASQNHNSISKAFTEVVASNGKSHIPEHVKYSFEIENKTYSIISKIPEDQLNKFIVKLIEEGAWITLGKLTKAGLNIENLPTNPLAEKLLEQIRLNKLGIVSMLLKRYPTCIQSLPQHTLNTMAPELSEDMRKILNPEYTPTSTVHGQESLPQMA